MCVCVRAQYKSQMKTIKVVSTIYDQIENVNDYHERSVH